MSASHVRIALACPANGTPALPSHALQALRALGRDVTLETHETESAIAAALRDPELDLVLLDAGAGALALWPAAPRPEQAPPVVVVTAPDDETSVARAFALGAAECVAAGPGLPEILPEVALEQVRLGRLRRERGEQARRLGELQQQLRMSQKLASIGQLAAGVAHEINNPMGFVHANLHQMSEYLGDLQRLWAGADALRQAARAEKPDTIREAAAALDALCGQLDPDFLLEDLGKALQESQEGSERVRRIVRELRRFARPDPGEPTPTDLGEALDAALRIALPNLRDAVEVERRYAALPPLRCHALQIQQVFLNLIVNAAQAMAGCAAADRVLELETRAMGDGQAAVVRDRGPGIAPEDRDRIFEPFFTTKDVGEGMGLGLSTCFAIAQRHGGRIEVANAEGGGCAFTLWLPADGAAS